LLRKCVGNAGMSFYLPAKFEGESSRGGSRPAIFHTLLVVQRKFKARTRSFWTIYICTRLKVWQTRETSTRRLIEVNAPQTHCSSSSGTVSPLFDLRSCNLVCLLLLSRVSGIEFHCQPTSSAQNFIHALYYTSSRTAHRVFARRFYSGNRDSIAAKSTP
jgi:hypothetical protein